MSLVGYKNSPRADVISAAARTIAVAEEFIDGRDLSTVEEADIPTIINSLQAIRHKAMVSDENQKQKRCDYLISEFNIILNKLRNQKTPRRNRSAWTPRGAHDQEQQMNKSAQRQTIELNNDEFLQLNQIVDSLLDECEIDSIEPQAIPKLDFVLKQRKKHAIDEGDYKEAKKIDDQIAKLSKIQQINGQAKFSVVFQYHQNPQLIDDAKYKLRNSEKHLLKLKADLEEENGRIAEQRDTEQAYIFKTIEDEVTKFEKYKEEVDLGFGFKPSRFLLDMRIMENRYVRSGLYDEAAAQRKRADQREIEERKLFDKNQRSLLNQKERQQKEAHRQKIATANQFWDTTFTKTQKKYAHLIAKAESEINSVKKWIKRLQGAVNEESYSESVATETANDDSLFEIQDSSTTSRSSIANNKKSKSNQKHNNQVSFNQRLPEASTTPLVSAFEPVDEPNNSTLKNANVTPNRVPDTAVYIDSPLDNDINDNNENDKNEGEMAVTIAINAQDDSYEESENENGEKTEHQIKLVPPTLEKEPNESPEEAKEVQINIDIPGFEEDNMTEQTKDAPKKIKKVKKVKKVVKKTDQ